MKVPFLDLGPSHLEIQEDLEEAFRRVVLSGRFILGRELDAFESAFSKYCDVDYCVGGLEISSSDPEALDHYALRTTPSGLT